MEAERFGCIIVGGGIAGLSAAMVLARHEVPFLLIERGAYSGAKNVSGGVLWGTDLARLVPEYWNDPNAGFERFINHRRLTFLDEQSAFSIDFKSSHYDTPPYMGVTVLRAVFDRWLADKVQEAIDRSACAESSFLAFDVLVERLLVEDGRVVGVEAGGERFYADCVILAEGVNNLLTRQIGLQAEYVPADHMAVGVKEVLRFDRRVLEDRFQLSERSGMANEFIGAITDGVEGGGFLYTNRTTVSIGLVLGMADLRRKRKKPYELLDRFKAHPVVADMIRGGEVAEYSAHVVSTGDMRAMPRELYADGVLVAGEAANLLLNAGKAIQGMDFAMHSGILAAETVLEARRVGDFSAATLRRYRERLEQSYVLQNMRNFQAAVRLLHEPVMHERMPRLVCDLSREFFRVENRPAPKLRQILREVVRRHSSLPELLKLTFRAWKAL